MPRLCVFGCHTGGLNLHVFPKRDAARFKAWVEIVSWYMGTPADCDYYKQKRICSKHFADKHKVANNRISYDAVPTLHLTGKSSEVEIHEQISSPQSPTQEDQNIPHVPCNTSDIETHELSLPESPTQMVQFIPCDSEIEILELSSSQEPPTQMEQLIPCNSPIKIHKLSPSQQPPTQMDQFAPEQSSNALAAVHELDHDYHRAVAILNSEEKSSTKNAVDVINSSVVNQLKATQRQVRNLKREICRLRKTRHILKERLKNAETINNNIALKRVTKNMTSTSKLFTEMQFRETAKKAKGRRFKIEEKILALSLYKRNPQLYPLLYKFFTLPSAKTLKQL